MNPIESAIAVAAGFLVSHADLIGLLASAIQKGVTRETLIQSIEKAMIAASDAEMRRELDP